MKPNIPKYEPRETTDKDRLEMFKVELTELIKKHGVEVWSTCDAVGIGVTLNDEHIYMLED